MKNDLKLSDFVFDVGRPVAYYPQFKHITGSTVATVFLCQMLYWTKITLGDWLYKSMDEWTEETGLSDQEQRTARKHLTEKGILIEKWDNINKQMFYRLDIRKLNEIWDNISGGHSDFTRLIIEKFDRDMKETPYVKPTYFVEEEPVTTLEEQESEIKRIAAQRKLKSDVAKKGDGVDMELLSMPSVKNSIKLGIILSHIEQRLGIIAQDARWKAFAKFALQRKELYGEDIRTFTTYAANNGFDPIYWSPEKCKTVWAKAFVNNKEDYSVPELPEPVKNPDALDSAPDKLFELSSRK